MKNKVENVDIDKIISSTIAQTLGLFAIYYFSGREAAAGYIFGLIIFNASK